ncbi:hypothetical protein BH20PSE1_BH20PSE1_19290 [soil metagenome]
MNTQSLTAKMLSKFKNGLNSWISLWHFLVHLENPDFYEGQDELREIQRTREARQRSDRCAAIEKRSHHGLIGTPRVAASRRSLGRQDRAQPRSGVRFSYDSIKPLERGAPQLGL